MVRSVSPYLTTDHRTMVEFPDRVWFGVRIMMKALGVGRAVIGIEKNKPDAIEALEKTKPEDLNAEVQGLYVKYPQGAEKMLIKAVTGREVPSGKLPMHVGAVVQNVGTIACIAEIFETGLPLVERVVTVTGPGVKKPGNLIVPVGAKFKDILAFLRRDQGERHRDPLRRAHDGRRPARSGSPGHEGCHRDRGSHGEGVPAQDGLPMHLLRALSGCLPHVPESVPHG